MTFMEFSGDGKTYNINKVQDTSGHLNLNKELAIDAGKKSKSECYNRVASIPAILIVEWIQKYGIDLYNPDHADGVKRLLNSSEYAYLRTNEMRL